MKALFDTNILIDYLSGMEQARKELAHYPDRAISIIAWMEVLAGTPAELESPTRAFLTTFKILPVSSVVAEAAVLLRRKRKLKLPDAVILATAQESNRLLITRNTRDFPAGDAGIRIPYRI